MPGENQRGRKEAREISLNIINTLIWPVLIIAVVFLFRPDLTEMMKAGVWKSGVLEVGNRKPNMQAAAQSANTLQKDYLVKI